ncbi:MAG: hypothetical protein OXD31_16165, partial [Chloroflexi bacterium]|nr:hypothetical protein [Chloroflexota bacterium]
GRSAKYRIVAVVSATSVQGAFAEDRNKARMTLEQRVEDEVAVLIRPSVSRYHLCAADYDTSST